MSGTLIVRVSAKPTSSLSGMAVLTFQVCDQVVAAKQEE